MLEYLLQLCNTLSVAGYTYPVALEPRSKTEPVFATLTAISPSSAFSNCDAAEFQRHENLTIYAFEQNTFPPDSKS